MSFTFGFGGDDVDEDGHDMLDDPQLVRVPSKHSNSLLPAQMHTLTEMVSTYVSRTDQSRVDHEFQLLLASTNPNSSPSFPLN
jgi:hypothetical protein